MFYAAVTRKLPEYVFLQSIKFLLFFFFGLRPYLLSYSFLHCVKYLFIFSPNAEKYGPEKTPYFDTFDAVLFLFKTSETSLFFRHVQDK